MKKKKIAVISDLHMSNNAEYSWFNDKQASHLVQMLNCAAYSSLFNELLILGDAFDLWLYPIDVPPSHFDDIINQWQTPDKNMGRSVIEALKLCVKNLSNVYYINGNHDMFVTREQVESICFGDNHIKWATPQTYMQRFNNRLHIEHGHAVDMFNAPDTSTDTCNGLPLGYYITRLAVTAENFDEKITLLEKLFIDFHKNHLSKVKPGTNKDREMGKCLVHTIIDSLILDLDLHGIPVTDKTEFVFADPKQNVTIGQVKDSYHSLLGRWHTGTWDQLLDNMLVCARKNGLDWYAKSLLKGDTPPEAVVFGHTHHSTLR